MENNNVVTCPPCGENVALATKRGAYKAFSLMSPSIGPADHFLRKGGRRGFTLIELLVVVLIIGILAAVAVPQYQKAVEKSKTTEAFTLLTATYKAAQAYYLANGSWPGSFEQLDIDLPLTGSTNWHSTGWHKSGKSNRDWSVQLYAERFDEDKSQKGVVVGRISGPYQGAGFYMLSPSSNNYPQIPTGKPVCVENHNYTSFPFTKEKGDYCTKIMGGTFIPTVSARNFFQLPY